MNLTHSIRRNKFKRSITDANKLALKFRQFWDALFDSNPHYCFGCGLYIPIMERELCRFKRPYNKEPIHESCWDAMQPDVFVKRVTEDSMLICHLDLGWTVKGSVCRMRVQNKPNHIMSHMIVNHGWKPVPDLVMKDIIQDVKLHSDPTIPDEVFNNRVSNGKIEQIEKYHQDGNKWFSDNQLIYTNFHNTHFLKPNGKSFPKVALA